jgi:hypothetical protein
MFGKRRTAYFSGQMVVAYFDVPLMSLPGGTEEDHNTLSQDSQSSDLDLLSGLFEYETWELIILTKCLVLQNQE